MPGEAGSRHKRENWTFDAKPTSWVAEWEYAPGPFFAQDSLRFGTNLPAGGLEVAVVFRLAAADFYLRWWLEIRSPGRDALFLDRIGAVENAVYVDQRWSQGERVIERVPAK